MDGKPVTAAVCISLRFVMVPESLTWSPRGVTDTLPNSSLPRDYVKIPRVLMVRLSNEPCRRCRHCRPCWRSPASQNGWGDGETRTANKLCQVFRRLVVKALSNSLNPPPWACLPSAAPHLAAPHPPGPFLRVPRNGATPGFDLSKPACRIKGNTCFDPGSRLAVLGRL